MLVKGATCHNVIMSLICFHTLSPIMRESEAIFYTCSDIKAETLATSFGSKKTDPGKKCWITNQHLNDETLAHKCAAAKVTTSNINRHIVCLYVVHNKCTMIFYDIFIESFSFGLVINCNLALIEVLKNTSFLLLSNSHRVHKLMACKQIKTRPLSFTPEPLIQ